MNKLITNTKQLKKFVNLHMHTDPISCLYYSSHFEDPCKCFKFFCSAYDKCSMQTPESSKLHGRDIK